MSLRQKRKWLVAAAVAALLADVRLFAQKIALVRVVSKHLERTVELPGEFYPFLSVELHAKVSGFVEKVLVDRGSFVKKGDVLVILSAPEMIAQISEAEARLTSAQSDQAQAEAQLAAARSTYSRTQEAAKTPGAVAENDLIQAKSQSEAAEALVHSRQRTVDSLEGNLKSLREVAGYLRVTAPFDGVISTRYIHPGALVGPDTNRPLLKLDQISRLRLAVAVPEADVAGLVKGARVTFKVPAFAERTFSGVIARPAYSLDEKTRTMPVELDVPNTQRLLAPGMYPSVSWPIERSGERLLVPATSIVTTTERVFVIRNDHGHAQWVDIHRGAAADNLVEIAPRADHRIKPGDEVVARATDEIRDGSSLP